MTDEREAMTDDAIILAMCKAHDAEEAAAIGEPSPWREDFDRDPDWAQARFLAMREAFDVCRAAHPRTGEPVAWPSDDEAILGTADELAERWAEKPAIRRMAQACASVFSEWASDDIISRFHEQMIALMKQSFVEGALHCRAHPAPEQGWPELPVDVVELVMAARAVAFGDPDEAAIKRLDDASEAFADRVPWDDEADGEEEA